MLRHGVNSHSNQHFHLLYIKSHNVTTDISKSCTHKHVQLDKDRAMHQTYILKLQKPKAPSQLMSHAEEDRIEPGHYVKSEVTQTKQKWSYYDDRQTWDTTKDKQLALQQLTINLGLLTQVQFQSFLNFHTTWMTAVTVTPTILHFIHGVNALFTHWIER